MFESLTERLGQALRNLRGVGRLTEENMAEALKEVRTALLSADVHFRVAREFVERVQAQAAGQQVLTSVTPAQQIVKIIHDELVKLLGEGATELSTKRPLKVLLVGLHGSGKTTSAAKLGRLLRSAATGRSWWAATSSVPPPSTSWRSWPSRRSSASTATAAPRTCPPLAPPPLRLRLRPAPTPSSLTPPAGCRSTRN